MRIRFTQLLIVLECFILLQSCVFTSKTEYFVEKDSIIENKEIDSYILDQDEDTIYLWKSTKFLYDFSKDGLKVINVNIAYADVEFSLVGNSGDFNINPEYLDEGFYKLTMNVITHSGTGSLGDILQKETLQFNKEWIIKVEIPKPPQISISSSIVDGFIRFTWSNMDKPYFKNTKIIINNFGLGPYISYERDFFDKDINTFVDSLYVGGKIDIRVIHYYYNQFGSEQREIGHFSVNNPISLFFHDDLDSLTISWSNPFHCRTYFYKDFDFFPTTSDTCHVLPSVGIGNSIKYRIVFKPIKSYVDNYYFIEEKFTIGNKLIPEYLGLSYSVSDGDYLFKNKMGVYIFDENFNKRSEYIHSYDSYGGYSIDKSLNNGEFSTIIENKIYDFSMQFEVKSSNVLPDQFYKTKSIEKLNDSIYIIGKNENFFLYNCNLGKVISNTDILPGGVQDRDYCYAISDNGKYVAFASLTGLSIYENKNNKSLQLIYKDEQKYYSCFFDIKNNSNLIVNEENYIAILNCSTTSIEGYITGVVANPINIDPQTGYMLLVSNLQKKIFVYDLDNENTVFEMFHHESAYDFRLYGNTIISNTGHVFSISTYDD